MSSGGNGREGKNTRAERRKRRKRLERRGRMWFNDMKSKQYEEMLMKGMKIWLVSAECPYL